MNQEKYAELFASEARDHVSQISRALVALETDPSDHNSLEAIFRSAHTIKGMAAAMGYDAVTRLAHSFESALDQLRAGKQAIDAAVIDLLLETSDHLEVAVEAAVGGGDMPDLGLLIERLDGLLAKTAEVGSARASPGPATPLGRGGRVGAGSTTARKTARVHVDIRRLDALMNLIGELMIVRSQMRATADELDSEELHDEITRASRIIHDLQAEVLQSRMVPVWQIFDRFPRLVRDAARRTGKEVEIDISGKDLELDRSLLDSIGDPLVHLLRNAVAHGIEKPEEREAAGKPRQGRIELSAHRERSRIAIVVSDDGRGIDREGVIARARSEGYLAAAIEPTDQELFKIMARPGFSTASAVTTLSGRGFGLNVVEECVRGLGGSIELKTEKGVGSAVRIELPLTLAVVHALIVEVTGNTYALPVTFIRETFELTESAIEQADDREWVEWRDKRVRLMRLNTLFNGGGTRRNGSSGDDSRVLSVVGLEYGGDQLVVSVDRLIGEEELVVKTFDQPLGMIPVFSGATVRPDGRPALLLDVGRLSDQSIRALSGDRR